MYEVNGEFPIPGADKFSFSGLAEQAGYRHSFAFADMNDFENQVAEILQLTGPVFVCLQVQAGEKFERDYATIHSAESRKIFRQAYHARLGINE